MSNASGESEQASSGQEAINRRAWPRDRQLLAAGIGIAVAAVLALAVWLDVTQLGKPATPAVAPSLPLDAFRASAAQLKTLTVESIGLHGFVSEESTEGKIAANGDHATPVFSPYSGRITRVIAGLGDSVRAGAPLATLEASEFVQAQNELATAVSQVKLARITESRKHALYDAKGGSLQDWQAAQNDLTEAETALSAIRNRLTILGKSPAEIAALESSHSINASATLTAPIAGVVVDRQVGPGQYVQAASSTPQFTIADISSVWLLANVRESDAALVKPGQSVEVHVPAYPERVFRARLSYVSAVVDPVTHRLPVRAEIGNRDGALKPEMFANFRIFTSDAAESPAVPQSAVIYEGAAAHVWVVAADGLLNLRSIRTGRSNDGLIEVLDGLKPGEKVVTKGGLFIDQAAVHAAS
jgi:cobalt-zinc-cadmium efflux system membrane fusion protein